MRFFIPEWYATARYDVRSPVSVPVAAVMRESKACHSGTHHVGFRCTRRPGHRGRHAAAMGNGEVVAVWA